MTEPGLTGPWIFNSFGKNSTRPKVAGFAKMELELLGVAGFSMDKRYHIGGIFAGNWERSQGREPVIPRPLNLFVHVERRETCVPVSLSRTATNQYAGPR